MKESVRENKQKKKVGSLHSNLCLSQVKQSQSAKEGKKEESGVLSELQRLREQLEKSEMERKALESQLCEANSTVTQLQEEGSCRGRGQRSNGDRQCLIREAACFI